MKLSVLIIAIVTAGLAACGGPSVFGGGPNAKFSSSTSGPAGNTPRFREIGAVGKDPGSYKIGPGDRLEIKVFEVADL